MTDPSRRAHRRTSGFFPGTLGCVLLCCSPAALGQAQASGTANAAAAPNTAEISDKIDQLTRSLEQTQVELAQSRTEIQELRATLKQVLDRMNPGAPGGNALTANAGVQPGGQVSGAGAVAASQQVAVDE